MHLDANDLLLFAEVIDCGSFSHAAEQLGLPKSTISRRISALEQQLGERLLQRTTRRLSITDFGQGILTYAQRMREENAAAAAYAQHRASVPSGRLRVSMPPDLSELILAPFFIHFAERYPEVKLELDLSARRVDLLAERFDLAIRAAVQLPDDATLVARKLCDIPGGLYASPAYLNRYGVPRTPDDLLHHTGLHLMSSNGEVAPWQLQRGDHHWQGLPDGPLTANSVAMIRLLLTHGLGIAQLGQQLVRPLIEQGQLIRILSDWQLPKVTLWGVTPGRKLIPAHTKAFLDLLTAHMAQIS